MSLLKLESGNQDHNGKLSSLQSNVINSTQDITTKTGTSVHKTSNIIYKSTCTFLAKCFENQLEVGLFGHLINTLCNQWCKTVHTEQQ